MKVTLAVLLCGLALCNSSRVKRQVFADCFEKNGAYCDYSCSSGYSEDPTRRCGLVTARICCVPNVTPPPGLTTINPPLNQCGVSKYGTEAGKMLPTFDKIVEGQDAYPNEFPWIVSMQFNSEHGCGGSIIDRQWILTAAHCFIGINTESSFSLSKIRIVAGEHRLLQASDTVQIGKLSKVFVHPDYNRFTQSNDVALIKLEQPLNFSSNVREICLPSKDQVTDQKVVVASGWGVTAEGDSVVPNTLQKVQLTTVPHTQCVNDLAGQCLRDPCVDETMMCASGEAKDTCQGDSGGPLIMRASPTSQQFIQVGVVSWGIGCASGTPGVYSKVSHFVDWIAATQQKN